MQGLSKESHAFEIQICPYGGLCARIFPARARWLRLRTISRAFSITERVVANFTPPRHKWNTTACRPRRLRIPTCRRVFLFRAQEWCCQRGVHFDTHNGKPSGKAYTMWAELSSYLNWMNQVTTHSGAGKYESYVVLGFGASGKDWRQVGYQYVAQRCFPMQKVV